MFAAMEPEQADKTSLDGGKHDSLSRGPDLAKLNPNFHLNYSIIFTEIRFYPETLRLLRFILS